MQVLSDLHLYPRKHRWTTLWLRTDNYQSTNKAEQTLYRCSVNSYPRFNRMSPNQAIGNPTKQDSSEDKWSSYWSGNRIAACMEAADGNYNRVISQHWLAFFSSLPTNSRILDLATGNGAVLHFAIDAARIQHKHLQLLGVDLAEIDPWSHLDRNQLKQLAPNFLPRINIESLPFANAMFDCVVSQFGAEYADLETMTNEAMRVLKPGGKLNWICHCDNSVVYANTVREISDTHYMLEQAAVTDHLQNIIKRQVKNGQFIPDSHRQTLHTPERKAMVQSLQGCFTRLRKYDKPAEILDVAIQNLAYIYQHREAHTPALVLEKIQQIHDELVFFAERLQALVNSAITTERQQQLDQLFLAGNMQDIQHQPVRKPDGSIVGTYISANRPLP